MPSSPPRSAPSWLPWVLLAAMAGAYAAYAGLAGGRLTNNLVGDSEFTGWTGPIAERFFGTEVPYRDFTLPIPPGSFALMRAVQSLGGPPRLSQELGLIAVCHLGMGLVAYWTSRAFSTPRTSLAVAAASLATVVQLYKECAYDHTAQLLAWISVAAAAHGLTHMPKARRWWWISGALATTTLAFKQSTGTGAVLGGLALHAYLGLVGWRSHDAEYRRRVRRQLGDWVAGAALGIAICIGLVALTRSSLVGVWQSSFIDGAALKGGTWKLVFNLFSYLFRFEAFPASLGIMLLGLLLARRARRGSPLVAASEDVNEGAAGPLTVACIGVAAFLGAAAMLSADASPPAAAVLTWTERAKLIPSFGLFALLVFVANWQQLPAVDSADRRAIERGHALLAACGMALTISLLHNLSFPGFRPFYDNNPIIVFAFLALFQLLSKAGLDRSIPVVLAAAMAVLFSTKLSRHLEATEPVADGHWAGLRVNVRGVEVVKAAARARELAGPSGTVLVLPEDVALARQIGRPRPPLLGAIVFVDQYPARALAPDLERLERDPPNVVVVHPADASLWRQMYALWSTDSPAQRLQDEFARTNLSQRYRLDSSFPTRFARQRAELQVWVRR
ncbi:MAG: hypothetical protein R3B13_24005 [Polyangiaceae bacterium]